VQGTAAPSPGAPPIALPGFSGSDISTQVIDNPPPSQTPIDSSPAPASPHPDAPQPPSPQ
jgi:hypothetical protein